MSLRILFFALMAALSSTACFGDSSNNATVPEDTGPADAGTTDDANVDASDAADMSSDATPDAPTGHRLELLTEPEPSVSFGQQVPVRVAVLDSDNTPVPDAVVAFEIQGDSADTKLNPELARTDADGGAETVIEAGVSEADFDVVIRVHGEDLVSPIIVPVAVRTADLWPSIAGTYNIESELDLGDVIPDQSTGYFRPFELFDGPGLAILRLTALASSTSYATSSPWNSLFATCTGPGTPELGCLGPGDIAPTSLGLALADYLEVHVSDQLAPTKLLSEVVQQANDVFENAEGLRLAGTMELGVEPDGSGRIVHSSPAPNLVAFNQITWRWDGTDRAIDLPNQSYIRGEGFEPVLTADAPYALAFDPFEVSFNVAEILLWVLEKVSLPLIFGPTVDGFDKVFGGVLNCEEVGDWLTCEGAFASDDRCNSNYAPWSAAIEAGCSSMAASAVGALADWHAEYGDDVETFYRLKTPASEPCVTTLGEDVDMVVSLGTTTQPCKWQGTLEFVNLSTSASLDATWHADRLN